MGSFRFCCCSLRKSNGISKRFKCPYPIVPSFHYGSGGKGNSQGVPVLSYFGYKPLLNQYASASSVVGPAKTRPIIKGIPAAAKKPIIITAAAVSTVRIQRMLSCRRRIRAQTCMPQAIQRHRTGRQKKAVCHDTSWVKAVIAYREKNPVITVRTTLTTLEGFAANPQPPLIRAPITPAASCVELNPHPGQKLFQPSTVSTNPLDPHAPALTNRKAIVFRAVCEPTGLSGEPGFISFCLLPLMPANACERFLSALEIVTRVTARLLLARHQPFFPVPDPRAEPRAGAGSLADREPCRTA